MGTLPREEQRVECRCNAPPCKIGPMGLLGGMQHPQLLVARMCFWRAGQDTPAHGYPQRAADLIHHRIKAGRNQGKGGAHTWRDALCSLESGMRRACIGNQAHGPSHSCTGGLASRQATIACDGFLHELGPGSRAVHSCARGVVRSAAALQDMPGRHPPDPAPLQIISSTEDVPGRYFNGWYCTYIPTTSTVETMDALDTQGYDRGAGRPGRLGGWGEGHRQTRAKAPEPHPSQAGRACGRGAHAGCRLGCGAPRRQTRHEDNACQMWTRSMPMRAAHVAPTQATTAAPLHVATKLHSPWGVRPHKQAGAAKATSGRREMPCVRMPCE